MPSSCCSGDLTFRRSEAGFSCLRYLNRRPTGRCFVKHGEIQARLVLRRTSETVTPALHAIPNATLAAQLQSTRGRDFHLYVPANTQAHSKNLAACLMCVPSSRSARLSRLRGAVRERKNSLVDMSRSRDRIVERLHALKKASEAELEKKALLAQSAEVRNSERQASLR